MTRKAALRTSRTPSPWINAGPFSTEPKDDLSGFRGLTEERGGQLRGVSSGLRLFEEPVDSGVLQMPARLLPAPW